MVGTYDLQQFALAQCAFTINHADLTDNARKAAFGRVHNMYIFTDLPPQPSEWTAKQLKALNRLLRSLLNSAVSWDTFQYIVQHHILTDPWLMSLKQSNQYDQFPLVLATCFNWQRIPYVTLEEDSSRETRSASLALFLKQWWIRKSSCVARLWTHARAARLQATTVSGPVDRLSHMRPTTSTSAIVSDAERAAARKNNEGIAAPGSIPAAAMLDNVGALREDVLSPLYEEEGQLLAHDQRASEAVDSPRASLAPVLQNNSAPDSLPRARSSSRSPAPSPSHSPSRSVTRSTPASPPNVVSDSSSPLPAGRIASAQSHSPASSASPSTVSVVQMMDVDPVSPGTSSSVDAGAGPSNFGAHRVARRNSTSSTPVRSSAMGDRAAHQRGRQIAGCLQATKKKRARYGGDEDD
ncbi:uncharacterized protein B0H18DRAFT_1119386 [Fomitopsis serialis]|uniref:uncharacterized protein n=1 Tax=Fomitopsis serialis TaxID=139415 RepID=UPI002007317C|nr:uncharacterized protein B0H18DRAFT_1119386 [Neoantrodia serialis]KAH9925546.1 hypothetical protein B0H18DRAFT_1119386 [Neoantrodia serialis]